MVSGVDRDPGDITAMRTPLSNNAWTNVLAHRVLAEISIGGFEANCLGLPEHRAEVEASIRFLPILGWDRSWP